MPSARDAMPVLESYGVHVHSCTLANYSGEPAITQAVANVIRQPGVDRPLFLDIALGRSRNSCKGRAWRHFFKACVRMTRRRSETSVSGRRGRTGFKALASHSNLLGFKGLDAAGRTQASREQGVDFLPLDPLGMGVAHVGVTYPTYAWSAKQDPTRCLLGQLEFVTNGFGRIRDSAFCNGARPAMNASGPEQ